MEDGEIHDQLPVEGTIYIYRYTVCTCTFSLALFSLPNYQFYGIINASHSTLVYCFWAMYYYVRVHEFKKIRESVLVYMHIFYHTFTGTSKLV